MLPSNASKLVIVDLSIEYPRFSMQMDGPGGSRTHALRIQGTLLCLLSYRPVKRQAAREASLEFAPVANGRLPVSNIAGCLLLDGEAPFDEHIVRDHVKASACEYRWKV